MAEGGAYLARRGRSASLPDLTAQKLLQSSDEDLTLQSLPPEIAKIIMELALATGRHEAYKHRDKEGRKRSAETTKKSHTLNLKKCLKGLMLDDSHRTILCDLMVALFEEFAKYYVATELETDGKKRSQNKKGMDEPDGASFQFSMREEFSKELIKSIIAMGQECIQYEIGLQAKKCHDSVAKADLDQAQFICSKISEEAKLLRIEFLVDGSTIIDKKLKRKRKLFSGIKEEDVKMKKQTLFKVKLHNDTKTEQTMEFSQTETLGKTMSTSINVGFKFGVSASFQAGFPGVGGLNVGAYFEVSGSRTSAKYLFSSTTKTHKFCLKAPAKTTIVGTATVDECEMNVPLKMVFDIGGQMRECSGEWEGVAVSKAHYHIEDEKPTEAKTQI